MVQGRQGRARLGQAREPAAGYRAPRREPVHQALVPPAPVPQAQDHRRSARDQPRSVQLVTGHQRRRNQWINQVNALWIAFGSNRGDVGKFRLNELFIFKLIGREDDGVDLGRSDIFAT